MELDYVSVLDHASRSASTKDKLTTATPDALLSNQYGDGDKGYKDDYEYLIYDDKGSEDLAYDAGRREEDYGEFHQEDKEEDFEEEEQFCYDDGLSLSEDDLEFDSDEGQKPERAKLTWPEKVDALRKRTFIDYLSRKAHGKRTLVLKTREELEKCRNQIKQHEKKRDEVFAEIQIKEEQDNIPAVFLLRSQHDKICRELELETELEAKIKEKLVQAEYQVNLVDLEEGRVDKLKQQLLEKEQVWDEERKREADLRMMKEKKISRTVIVQEQRLKRLEAENKREEEEKRKHIEQEAVRCHERHRPFLTNSHAKVKELEDRQKQREAAIMDSRIKTVLTLKSDIIANKENLKVQITRSKAKEHHENEMKRKWLEEIEAEGKNATIALTRQRRLNEFNKEKQRFEDKQREREIEIAKKILAEKDVLKRRRKLNPELFTDTRTDKSRFVKPLPKRNLRVVEQVMKNTLPPPSPEYDHTRGAEENDSEPEAEQNLDAKVATDDELCRMEIEAQENGSLAQPEFEGLWDQFKPYKAPKEIDKMGATNKGRSKMEKKIMAQRLQKLREGIIVKQVAVGREFKGCAFKSKPEVIHFKDFEVGKTYQKKAVLTNISHTLNICKLSGLSEVLKDFIELTFNPPGQMSAGLTCDLMVTFKPMINRDLEGEVMFLAQTGPFSIPIVCSTKKCLMKVDSDVINFGTSVVGETLRKIITLTNAGALPTTFQFYRKSDSKTENTVLKKEIEDNGSLKVEAEIREETVMATSVEGKESKEREATKEERMEEKMEEKLTDPGANDEVSHFLSSEVEYSDIDTRLLIPEDMKVGQVASGAVDAYSSVKLEIVWQPSIPGRVSTDFILSFDTSDVSEILLTAIGDAVEIPIWVERRTVDLKICMFDRLYQDSVIISNRAATAYSLKFEVCKELKNHMELLPKSGFIQAHSQFTAQLKFLPRKALTQDASQYYDKDTGVFEAPLVIHVVGQTLPVLFSVHAVVTTSDMKFDQTELYFGHCTTCELAVIPIKLTNMSLLPQQFGFMGCPDFVDIQPNDGFGTLLPQETINLDVIFCPKKADIYNFELVCKSLINREFKVQCSGVGVHPLMKLSQQIVQFRATAINDFSTVSLEVINTHDSPNEFVKPAPRIGKGATAPVGPTSFEFIVPEGVPISIYPRVGTVLPGQKFKVCVRFAPAFSDLEVRQEAVYVVTEAREVKAEEEFQMALQKAKEEEAQVADQKGKKDKSGRDKPVPKATMVPLSSAAIAEKGPASVTVPAVDEIVKNSPEFFSGLASLIKKFSKKFNTYSIPCYLASGACGVPGQLNYSVENTLFLEVHCPVIQPQLMVLSDASQTTIDFGEVSVGQRIVKTVTVQNISGQRIDLYGSCLNPEGPFILLNALRTLMPDQIQNLKFSFAPHKTEKFQQVQEIRSSMSTMYLTLKGVGVSPVVTLSVSDNLLDVGNVLAGDVKEETFKIINTSKLSVDYKISLDSQSICHKQRMQLMAVINASSSKYKNYVGTQNLSGKQVFDCIPREGSINPGATQNIVVTFSPDQPSEHFRDRCHIRLFGQDEDSHSFEIIGRGQAHTMYIAGGEILSPEVETLSVVPELERDEDAKAPAIPVLVTLHSIANETESTTATKDIIIGCVKVYSGLSKKAIRQNAEWSFEGLQHALALGFSIDPIKGSVEAGSEHNVTISWTPPAGHNPNSVASTVVNCTIKGDITETYKVILKAFLNAN